MNSIKAIQRKKKKKKQQKQLANLLVIKVLIKSQNYQEVHHKIIQKLLKVIE